jgi:hypothetical protein
MFDSWKIDSQGAAGFSRNRYLLAVFGTLAAIAAMAVGLFAAAPAMAIDNPPAGESTTDDEIDPIFVDIPQGSGQPDCGDLAAAYPQYTIGPNSLGVEPVVDGTYNDANLNIRVDEYDTDDGPQFDWNWNSGRTVNAVLAKGATDGNLYVYLLGEYEGGDIIGDTGLHAPINSSGKYAGLSHLAFCYGDEETQAASSAISTAVHLGDDHNVDIKDTAVALGSTVHDSAALTTDPSLPNGLPNGSSVTFNFYEGDCTTEPTSESDPIDVSGQAQPDEQTPISIDPALAQGPLHAGDYAYSASFTSGDTDVVTDSTSLCEPFGVDMGDTTTTTQVHDAAHNDITNKGVTFGSYVHDTASVVGDPVAFDPTGTVTYSLYKSNNCTGDKVQDDEAVDVGAADGAASTPVQLNTPGNYSYSAAYSGDSDYNESTGACEPFTVNPQFGKTMGFWGNNNGRAFIIGHGGYSGNAVAIGRGSNIDTQDESLKVLPTKLNACGKGTPQIFTVGGSTSANCTLATVPSQKINIGTLNTAAAQTLALKYNIMLVTVANGFQANYDGQTISGLGCTAVGSLTGASAVGDVFTYAVGLIDGSAANGSTTQSQLGALNTLLGCLNREA